MYRALQSFGIAHLENAQPSLGGRTVANDVDGLKLSDASKSSCIDPDHFAAHRRRAITCMKASMTAGRTVAQCRERSDDRP